MKCQHRAPIENARVYDEEQPFEELHTCVLSLTSSFNQDVHVQELDGSHTDLCNHKGIGTLCVMNITQQFSRTWARTMAV
ncbi:uncharacterized protein PHALS_13156 [Plasmopara halstedii]|uniref:Uncharacterized protein n=1 Tax=Plasmopara halstedii TaxID=4781 RepID=A0A0P1AP89_PLAHL|nr:uncharacterized protein PHALS_13156 [Plasmopara halstedii]CEG42921.1 hypothetical protein PHALS_13156 [Plasmopara halstedii]|eukprot:XP_024579290.1 hypothetical protein PHALS_13156 [Plasmopara halstedii]